MKRHLILILSFLSCLNISSQIIDFDTLNQVVIPIISQRSVDLKTHYIKETTIYPFGEVHDYIYGISISGEARLKHDTSLVRVILLDESDNEYLIFEANQITCNGKIIPFVKACEETSILDSIIPISIQIVLQNSEIEISTIRTFKIDENTKKHLWEYKDQMRKNVNNAKLREVKDFIKRNKMIWSAKQTPTSILSYQEKKKIYGKYYNTYGIEYYKDGFFEYITGDDSYIGGSHLTNDTTNFIKTFDWRNRHDATNPSSPYYGGSDGWITPNKCQAGCWLGGVIRCDIGNCWDTTSCISAGGIWKSVGTCWAFSTVASTEALVNLYYNQQLDLDLSEQQIVSCSHGIAEPWLQSVALDYLRDSGVVDEDCYSYLADDGDCADVCLSPSDKIQIDSYQYPGIMPSTQTIKKKLIEQGPMSATHGLWPHALCLVGFDTVAIGDYIDYIGGEVIDEDDTLYLGKTYWIFKQSDTYTGWPYHTGYIYMLNKPLQIYPVNTPITSLVFDSTDINCYDKDNDGYYWWGIGEKPSTCPSCCPDDPDGDDNNADLGPLDINGYCTEISSPYSYNTVEVTTNTTWNSSTTICGDLIIKNGATLTITSDLYMNKFAKIEIQESSELLVNGGTISNSNLLVISGKLSLTNNATLEINSDDALDIRVGAELDYFQGEIKIISE